MLFHEFGGRDQPTVILLHGAGLSWWAYREIAALLMGDYHVVLPVIDGYAGIAGETFQSIEQSAQTLINYIQAEYHGRVYALGGLSLGAQIAVEVLSREPEIAAYAVLESALTMPMPGAMTLVAPLTRLSFGLIKHRWFANWQAKALSLPTAMMDEYYADSLNISLATLINTLQSNTTYQIKPGLAQTKAKTLVIAGAKEIAAELKSARLLHQTIAGSELWTPPDMKHGELSLQHPAMYVDRLRQLFDAEAVKTRRAGNGGAEG